jgi:hypothetical protein
MREKTLRGRERAILPMCNTDGYDMHRYKR